MDSLGKCTSILEKHCDDLQKNITSLRDRVETKFERSYTDPNPKSASSARYNPKRLVSRVSAVESQYAKSCDEYVVLVKQVNTLLGQSLASSHINTKALLESIEVHIEEPIPAASELHSTLDETNTAVEEYCQEFNPREAGLLFKNDFLDEARDEVADMDTVYETRAAPEQNMPPPKKGIPRKAGNGGRKAPPPKLNLDRKATAGGGRFARSTTPASTTARTPASTTARGAVSTPEAKPKAPKKEPQSILKKPKPSSVFQPIQKSAYQRLPRNLKLGAGKLDPLNELYKKTFDVLIEKQGSMQEAELLKATGEKDAKRLNALRGLSILRNTAAGWELIPSRVT